MAAWVRNRDRSGCWLALLVAPVCSGSRQPPAVARLRARSQQPRVRPVLTLPSVQQSSQIYFIEDPQVAKLRQAVEAEWDKERRDRGSRVSAHAYIVILNKPVGLAGAHLGRRDRQP